MTLTEIRALSDKDLVTMLTSQQAPEAAVAWLAGLLADPTALEGVNELGRRYRAQVEPEGHSPRYVGATTVSIDPTRWSAFFFKRRLPLNSIGGLMEPARCAGWASVIKRKARVGLYALCDLATALDVRFEDLLEEVAADEERERFASLF